MALPFLEFKPRLDPQLRVKYDPMAPEWKGIEASENAIKSGVYKLDEIHVPVKTMDVATPVNPSDKDIGNLKPYDKKIESVLAPKKQDAEISCSIQ
jgi:hypothetical protein